MLSMELAALAHTSEERVNGCLSLPSRCTRQRALTLGPAHAVSLMWASLDCHALTGSQSAAGVADSRSSMTEDCGQTVRLCGMRGLT